MSHQPRRYVHSGRQGAVLWIDNDPAMGEAIARRLAGCHVRVLTAAHGTQGLALAVDEPPDLMITDLPAAQPTTR